MADGFISISEMVEHMNSGSPFSMVYVTYDKATGKGGGVKFIEMATKCWPRDVERDNGRTASTWEKKKQVTNPNHFQNSTVNVRVSAAGQADIRKAHIQLIRRFNGLIVK